MGILKMERIFRRDNIIEGMALLRERKRKG